MAPQTRRRPRRGRRPIASMMFKRLIPALLIGLGVLLAWAFSVSQRSAPKAPPPASRVLPVPRVHIGALRADHNVGKVDAYAAPPARIRIPAIGVSARVVPLGLNRDGTIQTPKAWDEVGW